MSGENDGQQRKKCHAAGDNQNIIFVGLDKTRATICDIQHRENEVDSDLRWTNSKEAMFIGMRTFSGFLRRLRTLKNEFRIR